MALDLDLILGEDLFFKFWQNLNFRMFFFLSGKKAQNHESHKSYSIANC